MEQHLGFEIRILSNLIYRRINQLTAMEEENLTAHQDWVLKYLMRCQDRDVVQHDVEREFSIRRSTASQMLRLMEENGLICRESVPYDARMKKLVITEKGQEAAKRMKERLNRFENELQEGFSTEEIELLLGMIKRLQKNIDTKKEK